MAESNGSNVGRVEQVTGVVVDAVFPDELPEIYSAVKIEMAGDEDREATELVCEVQQHLGDDRVRTVAMDATDGLQRGDKVIDTGGPITVPVGDVDPRAASSTCSASRSTRASRSRPASAGRSTGRRRKPPTSPRPRRSSRPGSR